MCSEKNDSKITFVKRCKRQEERKDADSPAISEAICVTVDVRILGAKSSVSVLRKFEEKCIA